MKKLITLAVAVLAGALLFTGCYSEIAPEYNKQSILNAEAEKAAAELRARTLFDPETCDVTQDSNCTIVTVNGKKYAKVALNGWNNFLQFKSFDVSKYSSVTVPFYYEAGFASGTCQMQFANDKWTAVSVLKNDCGIPTTLTNVTFEVSGFTATSTNSLKMYAWDNGISGAATTGWMYIGKIIANK